MDFFIGQDPRFYSVFRFQWFEYLISEPKSYQDAVKRNGPQKDPISQVTLYRGTMM